MNRIPARSAAAAAAAADNGDKSMWHDGVADKETVAESGGQLHPTAGHTRTQRSNSSDTQHRTNPQFLERWRLFS